MATAHPVWIWIVSSGAVGVRTYLEKSSRTGRRCWSRPGRCDVHAPFREKAPVVNGEQAHRTGRGGRWMEHRQVINGIFVHIRTGIPWAPPRRFVSGQTCYDRHRHWSAADSWERRCQSAPERAGRGAVCRVLPPRRRSQGPAGARIAVVSRSHSSAPFTRLPQGASGGSPDARDGERRRSCGSRPHS